MLASRRWPVIGESLLNGEMYCRTLIAGTSQALPGGGGIGSRFARAGRAQSWGQRRHDQALVGAERSRVGIRLGLPVPSKPHANPGTFSGENERSKKRG